MRSFRPLPLIFILAALLAAAPLSAAPDKKLLAARETLLSPAAAPLDALDKYLSAARTAADAAVMGEYAYALARAGLAEAAFYNIDRALITEHLDPEVRFYLAELLNAAGLEDASAEQGAPVPAWLGVPLKLPALDLPVPDGDFDEASAAINLLMAQKRYAAAAVLYDRLCKKMPDIARCRAGRAITLEKLGAYRSAAAAAKEELALTTSPERSIVIKAYISDLENRPPLKYGPQKPVLKGRYLAYLGGAVNRSGGGTITSLRGRLGRFLTERVDVSANIGFTGGNDNDDYNGLTAGLGGRYNRPLGRLPLHATAAARLERAPSPDDEFTALLSPGLSYFTPSGSLDLYLDFALTGPYGGGTTLSLGYTVYFGGGK
ncbi:MAG TPA: hypothetical protein PKK31_03360 [Elusimicrobiales bacterium]|nr:hypothetical protein [Elusimicrobiales bacterium]